jgi:hypothetical protein
MNTSYAMSTYRSHDLNIAMKTSSGDVIKLDFANEQSASIQFSQNDKNTAASMSFSSMQSFQFSIKSNGIDEQDQKEIDAFMKTAQPFINDFLKELRDDAPKSPVTQLAHQIAGIFEPNKERSEDAKNAIKTNIVKMFDKALQKLEPPKEMSIQEMTKKILEDTQKLLEKTLKEFHEFNKKIYA